MKNSLMIGLAAIAAFFYSTHAWATDLEPQTDVHYHWQKSHVGFRECWAFSHDEQVLYYKKNFGPIKCRTAGSTVSTPENGPIKFEWGGENANGLNTEYCWALDKDRALVNHGLAVDKRLCENREDALSFGWAKDSFGVATCFVNSDNLTNLVVKDEICIFLDEIRRQHNP